MAKTTHDTIIEVIVQLIMVGIVTVLWNWFVVWKFGLPELNYFEMFLLVFMLRIAVKA
jgi:hypothetical protein